MASTSPHPISASPARQLSETLWSLPTSYKPGMRVEGRIVASPNLMGAMDAAVFDQLANVASLPGIVGHAWCMPDGHSGYGFPIGGAAAFDLHDGIISPGGIGFDINCGMRLVRTSLSLDEVQPRITQLVDELFNAIPVGVGKTGIVEVSRDEFRELIEQPMEWCIRRGYATADDVERTEGRGCMAGADAAAVSERAVDRGYQQIGTLGSGNHYLEIQVARPKDIRDPERARVFGIDRPSQILIMLHCGSRGFGHQVGSDYLKRFISVMESTYALSVPDRELACAPFQSPDGQRYYAAMQCAVNMAFANRQVILHRVREVFSDVFGRSPDDLGMRQIYDVTHNTARVESHLVDGETRELLVHRKGATRAFAPGMPGLPDDFKEAGQPVIIGGSMETGSYLLAGASTGANSWFTTAHGSGRTMGRRQAKRTFRGDELRARMLERGIYVRSSSDSALAEEAGGAYKDIDEVVAVTEQAGLSVPVARLTPLGNIKG